MWEKRYGFLRPQRTDTNIRYYADSDLNLLRLIQRLNSHGIRISKIAEMSLAEIEDECKSISLQQDDYEIKINQGLIALDVTVMESVLDEAIRHHGFESVLMNLILPFLEKMETMWLSGKIGDAHEACFRELIKRKTIRELDLIQHNCSGPRVIMFLPKGNKQELSHLFMHYFLRKYEMCVTDIGCDINIDCAISAITDSAAENVLLVNADAAHWQFGNFVNELIMRTKLPVIVSGRAADEGLNDESGRLTVFDTMEETIHFFNKMPGSTLNHMS